MRTESRVNVNKPCPPMSSTNHKGVIWLICRGFKQHKKKFIFCSLFFGVFILFHVFKARDPVLLKGNTSSVQESFTAKENENLEDELNELVSQDVDESTNKSPTNLEVSSEYCRDNLRYLFLAVAISLNYCCKTVN